MVEGENKQLKRIVFVQTTFFYRIHDFILVHMLQIRGHGDFPRRFREKLSTYLEIIEKVVKEGKEQKISADCNEKLVAAAFFGMTTSILALKVIREEETVDTQEITDTVFNFALNGLKFYH
ncbi:TetR/AcrR family transcriptional regulator C-terminal domain-containing protein [Caldanaerobacter subterraneus]|nr:TetR/AcrR family transcriptional regulator C-terminal domain-containing protein [Caldanaerobacter subterraneus]